MRVVLMMITLLMVGDRMTTLKTEPACSHRNQRRSWTRAFESSLKAINCMTNGFILFPSAAGDCGLHLGAISSGAQILPVLSGFIKCSYFWRLYATKKGMTSRKTRSSAKRPFLAFYSFVFVAARENTEKEIGKRKRAGNQVRNTESDLPRPLYQ